MKDISELKTVTEHGLHELVADHRLKQRIIEQACAEGKSNVFGSRTFGRMLAAAAVLTLVLLLSGNLKTEKTDQAPQITQIAAGAKSRTVVWVGEKKYVSIQSSQVSAAEPSEDSLIGEIGKGNIYSDDLPSGTRLYRLEDGSLLAVTPDHQILLLQEE
jgi:hypothetical protein